MVTNNNSEGFISGEFLPEIDIQWVKFSRDLNFQRQTGLPTMSVTMRVVYQLGSFELVLQVDSLPKKIEDLEELLRQKVVGFADALKISALKDINIPNRENYGDLQT